MNEVRLPIDLPQLPQFGRLKEHLGQDAGKAVLAWYILWQQLAYRMQEGETAGRLPGAEIGGLIGALEPVLPERSAREALVAQLENPIKLLLRDGHDLVCPRFAAMHAGLNPLGLTREAKGGYVKAFKARQHRAEEGLLPLTMAVKPEKYKDADGNPLSSEEIQRINWLIVTCDNALGKPDRPPYGFTEALIADAAKVVRQFSDDQIHAVALELVSKRAHPYINGMITERLLPQFQEIMPRIAEMAA